MFFIDFKDHMENHHVGYLRRCSDRRFGAATRRAFEEATGLGESDYWDQANPGGAAVDTDPLMADYAMEHGAKIWGWQAHGDRCGGIPGTSNEEIEAMLDEKLAQLKVRYPGVHVKIIATEAGTTIHEL